MVRRAVLIAALLGVLSVAMTAGADSRHTGIILHGRGPCHECYGPTEQASVQYIPIPEGASFDLIYTPVFDRNELRTQVRPGRWGNPDLLAVFGTPGTLSQPYEVIFQISGE